VLLNAAPIRPSGPGELCRGTSRARQGAVEDLTWRQLPVNERLSHALVQGITQYIVEDTEAAGLKPSARCT